MYNVQVHVHVHVHVRVHVHVPCVCMCLCVCACACVRVFVRSCACYLALDVLTFSFRRVLKREGLRGLYKGLTINFVKAGPMVGLSFTTNDLLKKWAGVSDYTATKKPTDRKV